MISKLSNQLSKLKDNTIKKKQTIRMVAIVSSIMLLIILSYQYIIAPSVYKLFYSKFPEIEEVYQAVHTRYSDGDVKVNTNWRTTIIGEEMQTTSSLIVTYSAKHSLEEKVVRDIGRITCSKLREIDKEFDTVVVVSYKSFLPFDVPFLHIGETDVHPGKC